MSVAILLRRTAAGVRTTLSGTDGFSFSRVAESCGRHFGPLGGGRTFATSAVALGDRLSSNRLNLYPASVRWWAEAGVKNCGCTMLNAFSMQQRRGVSKLKKYKIKAYSSYKERFKLMADGTYKRWRSGTRHNAHSKTAKQRRHLRQPSIAPLALAKVMKKLNFAS